MKAVLITGARAPVAYDLARAFRDAGYPTHLADCVPAWAARGVRPGIPRHRFASPRHDFAAFRRDLNDLVERLAPVFIIPTCEEVFYVSEAAARDGYADRVFAPPLSRLRPLHSKWAFAQLARECGVTVPETWLVTAPEERARVPLSPHELVLKPEFSRFGTQTLIRPTERETRTVTPSPAHRWVAQRFIAGVEVCSWAAVRGGAVVAFAAYRPRWHHAKAAIAFEAVDSPGARRITERIAAATGMTGHLSLDYIETPDGTVLPIECNPRAVSGVHLFDADPALARAILGEGAAPTPAPGIVRYLAPAMAMLGLPGAVARGQAAAWWRDVRRGADVIGRPGDRLPVLGAVADFLRFAAQGVIAGRTVAEQTTANIEWNGEPLP